MTEEERMARAALLRVGEPGDVTLLAAVRTEGALATWQRLRAQHPDVDPRREWDRGRQLGARLVCPGDPEWPPGLADLDRAPQGGAAPLGLWMLGGGRLPTAGGPRAVAVVGARSATGYGLDVAGELGFRLAEQGWTVISGAAFGIDAAAHRGCLAADAATVAVLAGGVDVPYPLAHTRLLERIKERGVLVSEAPLGAAPLRRRFLVRNRLIAALSRGTVVVEAGVRSGALSTARHARRLGRPVAAVPGPVTSGLSAGCHLLLRHWPEATLVTCAEEVIEAVGAMGELAPLPTGDVGPRDQLDALLRRVLDAVPARRCQPSEAIATGCQVPVETVDRMLPALVAHGLVEQRPEGYRLTELGRAPSNRPSAGRGAGGVPA